jgi:hypothetical protein
MFPSPYFTVMYQDWLVRGRYSFLFVTAFSSSSQNVFWYIHLNFHMSIYFHINSLSSFSLIQYILNTYYTSTCSIVSHAITTHIYLPNVDFSFDIDLVLFVDGAILHTWTYYSDYPHSIVNSLHYMLNVSDSQGINLLWSVFSQMFLF